MMPEQRTAALMGDFFGLPMAEVTVLAASEEARARLQPTVDFIGHAIQGADVAHADETGMCVAGSLHWMHILATGMRTCRVPWEAGQTGIRCLGDPARLSGHTHP